MLCFLPLRGPCAEPNPENNASKHVQKHIALLPAHALEPKWAHGAPRRGELTRNTKNTYAETIFKWPSGLDFGGSWGQPWITPPAAASGASWSCSSNKTSSTFGSRFGGNLAVERHGGAASPTQGAEKRYFLTPLSIKVLRLP